MHLTVDAIRHSVSHQLAPAVSYPTYVFVVIRVLARWTNRVVDSMGICWAHATKDLNASMTLVPSGAIDLKEMTIREFVRPKVGYYFV